MQYQELFYQENTQIRERYDLAAERIAQMGQETVVQEPYRDFFVSMSRFMGLVGDLALMQMRDQLETMSLEELKEWNRKLYLDILPENYDHSYGNPDYAAQRLGKELGPLLSAFYAQLRGCIVFAYECRLTDITILGETLIEIYNRFEEEVPTKESIRDILYWFFSDYTDVTLTYRIREQLDPSLTFARDLVMDSDLTDLRYLYRFGEYVSDNELRIAEFLNSLPEETIGNMARTFTEGYRKGFAVMGRDLSKKRTVGIRYELGFERMIREAVRQFGEMGLEAVLYRAAVWSVTQTPGRKVGYHSGSVNRQYDYDHRYDQAIYLDKAFKDRKLGVLKTAYEQYKKEAADYAGPAVVETFGREGFQPVNRVHAYTLSPKQQELSIALSNESMQVVNRYIPGDETSFTIIAFPVPEVGADFSGIFADTIRINTLDYELYLGIQQRLIEILDQADQVHITGRGANQTDIRVSLHRLEDVTRQTNFENCVADVNIPVGEVFTSPVLSGTTGLLHVGKVYLGNIQFRDLKIRFRDGMVEDYSCGNFPDPEEGRILVRQEILKNHDTLPLGEFAIGTNTAAYEMAERYGIMDRLPILIAEKTGPHFAVGDTCYSWSEDSPVYNPDGREVIARDNEISILRREDAGRAYFGCHTDITIPYSELGDIAAVCPDGRERFLVRAGRFVAEGTEVLNEALERMG